MSITSEKVLLKMNEIQGKGNRPVEDWHELRRWLLEDDQVMESFAEAVISDPEMSNEQKEYWLSSGADLIAAERIRQINSEGWDAKHDDEHASGELVRAGVAYVMTAMMQITGAEDLDLKKPPMIWPWDEEWWKPKDVISNLKRGGALIAAEIDRVKRLKSAMGDV